MSDKQDTRRGEDEAPPEILQNNPRPISIGLRGGGGGGGRGGGMGTPIGMGDLRKPRDLKGTIKKLLALLAGEKLRLGAMMAFNVLSTLCATLAPWLLGLVTNEIWAG